MTITTTYTLTNTRGNLSFTIKAGGALGPHEPTQNTDLTFYGYSRTGWGQEVDQNFYRLLENFACPELVAHPVASPRTKIQLGGKLGINVPIIGQTWFNTTSNELYMYSPGSSQIVTSYGGSSEITVNDWQHIISETYADRKYAFAADFIGGNEPLLKSGANSPMTGRLLLYGAPTLGNHAATKTYVDTEIDTAIAAEDASIRSFVNTTYVHKTGDNITGGLAVTGAYVPGFNALASPFILATISGGNARFEMGNSAPFSIVSGEIVNNYITSTPYIDFHSSGYNTDCDTRIIASGGTNVAGQGTLQFVGHIVDDGRAPTLSNQLVHKSWVDASITTASNSILGTCAATYLKKAGDAMTGQLNMNGHYIVNVADPTTWQAPTTLAYIRDHTYGPSDSVWSNHKITISGANPSGGSNGDIWFKV